VTLIALTGYGQRTIGGARARRASTTTSWSRSVSTSSVTFSSRGRRHHGWA